MKKTPDIREAISLLNQASEWLEKASEEINNMPDDFSRYKLLVKILSDNELLILKTLFKLSAAIGANSKEKHYKWLDQSLFGYIDEDGQHLIIFEDCKNFIKKGTPYTPEELYKLMKKPPMPNWGWNIHNPINMLMRGIEEKIKEINFHASMVVSEAKDVKAIKEKLNSLTVSL
jgi:hypothetical protein